MTEHRTYAFFCLVLFSDAPGVNACIGEYLREHFRVVHEMSGDQCLVITAEDVRGIVDVPARPDRLRHLTSVRALGVGELSDAFAVSRHLGLTIDYLPCAVLFESGSAEYYAIAFKELLDGDCDMKAAHAAFVTLFAAVDSTLASKPGKRTRLLAKSLAASRHSGIMLLNNALSAIVRGLANAAMDRAE
jgi:hypothetical protein